MSDTDLMQAIFDGTDVYFYVKDAEGRFLLVNAATAKAYKVSVAECVGKSDYDFLPKEDADRIAEKDRQAAGSGAPVTFRNVVNPPEGRRVVIDHKFPVSVEGHPSAIAGIAIDITDVE